MNSERTPANEDIDYYESFAHGYRLQSTEKRKLLALVKDQLGNQHLKTLVDVGPGDGEIAESIVGYAEEVVLIEKNEKFCEVLRKRFPNARVIHAGVEVIDLPRAEANLVLCSHVLYYLPLDLWRPTIEKLFSWLTPGGKLVVVLNDYDCEWFRVLQELSKTLGIIPDFSYYPAHDFFANVCGGATTVSTYESSTLFDLDERGLVFMLGFVMNIPRNLLLSAYLEAAKSVFSSHNEGETIQLKFKHRLGIWIKK